MSDTSNDYTNKKIVYTIIYDEEGIPEGVNCRLVDEKDLRSLLGTDMWFQTEEEAKITMNLKLEDWKSYLAKRLDYCYNILSLHEKVRKLLEEK